MHKQAPVSDPFAMLMDLQGVVQAMERSDRLARLQSRICRPLDKPLVAGTGGERDDFDGVIDAAPEADES
ncbi:MAG: hypothetical protein KA151_07165 [Piscinibacter sp.]|nr:hypothetical protein [Piscinibacter sp.]